MAASRPVSKPLTPPDAKRGALFIGTRPPAKPVPAPLNAVIEAASPEPVSAASAPESAAPGEVPALAPEAAFPLDSSSAVATDSDSDRADVVAATEAMPWLFEDPGASQPVLLEATKPDLVGLSDELPRADLDVAAVLDSIAARVRAGAIDVSGLDPAAGEAAALATVLAALLRPRAR